VKFALVPTPSKKGLLYAPLPASRERKHAPGEAVGEGVGAGVEDGVWEATMVGKSKRKREGRGDRGIVFHALLPP
jgi:hypothetical protein